MVDYHDQEWGVPSHDDRHLFEMLILEGAQAGLSWETILKRREGYRAAFDNFDPRLVAHYGGEKKQELLQDVGIIRNRAKIDATVLNAQAFLRVQEEFGSFDAFLWGIAGNRVTVSRLNSISEGPTKTEDSDRLSKELLKRGFKFVGSTICYAYMQAVGIVNDHVVSCPRFEEVQR